MRRDNGPYLDEPGLARRLCAAAALSAWLIAAAAAAQQAPPPEPPAQPAPSSVTVTAKSSGYRSSIDSRSYSIANDLAKDAGSLADVLRNVPAVQVDMDGNVSIRGEQDVTILVDGKPSALFSGPGRAQALQAISPDQYERIEVMTNPPAGVTAEGSGGVINLISKKPPAGGSAPVASGTVKAMFGSGDRFNEGVSGVYSGNGLSLTGGGSFLRQAYSRSVGMRYGYPDPTTGALVPAYSVSDQGLRGDTLTLYGTAGYDLDPKDHLDASVNVAGDRSQQALPVNYQSSATAGPFALDYLEPRGFWHGHFSSIDGSVGGTRTLPGEGQTLSVKLYGGQVHQIAQNGGTFDYTVPVQPNLYQDLSQVLDAYQLDLKIDYKNTLPNKAKIALGYEGKLDWQRAANRGVQGGAEDSALPVPALAQRFVARTEVEAIYATYDQAIGKLTVQPGLRLEEVTLDTDLLTAAQKGRQDYFEAYPSLHLDYDFGDLGEVKASYGRRAQRPFVFQLDPFRNENSPTSFSAGNPDLRPAITQSWEVGYEFRHKTTDYQVSLFYRDKANVFTGVTEDIGGDVLLSTYSNLGHQHDAGLELVAKRDLIKNVTLSASTDLMQSQVDAVNLGITGVRSAFIPSANATVNWQVTPSDYLQLGGQAQGRQLTAQGYVGGAHFANIGWRHKVDPRLALVVTGQDPFGLARRTLVTDTPSVDIVEKRKFNDMAFFLGLTYALGAAPKRAPDNYDFGQSTPSGQ